MKILGFFLILFLFCSCKVDRDNPTRAYVEGHLTTAISAKDLILQLENKKTVIGETHPETSGNFSVSGPLLDSSEGFSIKLNSKIKSFSSTKPDLRLSADSLQIIVPQGITYLKIAEIILKK